MPNPAIPPDPSQPNPQTVMIRQEVFRILADPMQYPDQMVSWLSEFIIANPPPDPVIPPAIVPPPV